jgi:hypothetical protein
MMGLVGERRGRRFMKVGLWARASDFSASPIIGRFQLPRRVLVTIHEGLARWTRACASAWYREGSILSRAQICDDADCMGVFGTQLSPPKVNDDLL